MTGKDDFDILTRWRLEAQPEELTAIVLDPKRIHLWCPSVFLDSELVERGRADGLGMTIRLYTKGFLPHSFFFNATIAELEPHRWMKIAVTGDFVGHGVLSITPDPDGRHVDAALHWRTSIGHPYVRRFVPLIRPVFVWNHKWAMRNARRLMQAEVHRRRGASSAPAKATFPHNIAAFRRWQKQRSAARGWSG